MRRKGRKMANFTRSDEQWRENLSEEEYRVLRQSGTEAPGSGQLLHEKRGGRYYCKGCGAFLFEANTKFDSGCGWPSFFRAEEGAVNYLEDLSIAGRPRVEVRCANCDSHLGHVFEDAPQTPTGKRYCMNSVCLRFEAYE